MQRPSNHRGSLHYLCIAALLVSTSACAQDSTNTPASIPAGVSSAQPAAPRPSISPKQAREAEDAYLAGAKEINHSDLEAAERDFGRALKLNPNNSDYELALASTRQQRVTILVQRAARARLSGDNVQSDQLLAQAHQLDPDSPIVNQHLGPAATSNARNIPVDASLLPPDEVGSTLGGPIEIHPKPILQSFHRRSNAQDMVRAVYTAYGIKVVFDSSVTANASLRLDVDDANYGAATRIVDDMAHVFAVPVQADTVLIAHDTQEDRDRLTPLIEETIYLPGVPTEEMTELANVARNVFDVKQVTASASGGDILVRGDEPTLKLLNATYDDMLDGGSDVLLDVRVYEVTRNHEVNIGAALPSSAGLFSIAAEATSLVNANQAILQQAIAAGLLKLHGTPLQNLITEVGFLIASGTVTSSQYTNLLGIFGNGLSFAGLYLGSNSTFNLLLNSSDVRALDAVTIRAGNHQESTFRAGTRYPIVTAQYSSGVTSALASQLSGINSSAASLVSQYLGSSSVNVPQFQYEDLGITLKTTPQIQHNGGVSLKLDLKIEALGGGAINSIPILDNRTLTSTINIPSGQTALLASLVNTNEMKSIEGLPGLSELPGFQGTDQDTTRNSDELLITITPHIVRAGALHIASRRLAYPRTGNSAQ